MAKFYESVFIFGQITIVLKIFSIKDGSIPWETFMVKKLTENQSLILVFAGYLKKKNY